MGVYVKDLGAATAYAAAVEGGYTGTKEEFEGLMASYAEVAEQAAESAAEAAASAAAAEDAQDAAETAAASVSEGETVKGNNLIPNCDNGIGAYYASGTTIKFAPNYTTYHYAVIPLKPNTDYYLNYYGGLRWYILAKNGVAVIGTENKNIYSFNSGELYDTLYITQAAGWWNTNPVICAEGIRGTNASTKKPAFLSGLTQNNDAGCFGCALPKRPLRLTQNISPKFYNASVLALTKNMYWLRANVALHEDGNLIGTSVASTSSNGYSYAVLDDNFNVVSKLEPTDFTVKADNLQNCSVLAIGDSTVQGTTGALLTVFESRSKTVTLLGTRGTAPNNHEGRSGWSAYNYCTKASVDGVTNAFWNPTSEAFDFSYYMTEQGYESVDFVVIQLGINDLWNQNPWDANLEGTWGRIQTIIDSILEWNASQKILINLPTTPNANLTGTYGRQIEFVRNIFCRFNELAIYRIMRYPLANVRESYCHLILDPANDISDSIHPKTSGYEKMANEIVNQINFWQN